VRLPALALACGEGSPRQALVGQADYQGRRRRALEGVVTVDDRSPDQKQHDQEAADQAAADRREADLQAAADSLAAERAAEDEAIAERRDAEDKELADSRHAQDRLVASARTRLADAAAALQVAVDGGNPAEVRVANAEAQAAVQNHLDTVPEPAPPPEKPAE
jgi:hypothetical protein